MSVATTLIMMCGLPFSGKTTLARILSRTLNWMYISLDDTISALGFWDQGYDITQNQWNEAYTKAHNTVRTALQEGNSVIYDETNYRRLHRDRLRQIAVETRTRSYVVYLDVSLAEVQARIIANRIQLQRGDITDEALRYVVERIEPPMPEEHVLLFTQDTPIHEWLSRTRSILDQAEAP